MSRPRGVNLVGYVRAESGVGQVGRSLAATLGAAGLPHRVVPFDLTRSRQEHEFAAGGGDELYDTSILCVNADQVPIFLERHGDAVATGCYTVGVWAWEVDVLPPSMAASGSLVDEVWGISTYAANCVRPWVPCPVRAFPLPVEIPAGHPEVARADLGLSESFLFLFCFDFDSVFRRKNPLDLVAAYRRAFPEPAGTQLLCKTINGEHHPREVERLREATAARPDTLFHDGYFTAAEQIGLVAGCDAYVSLHRSEGFGLTMAEAMAVGKPVIATGYSANLDFMDEENSFLVAYGKVPVGPGSEPYPPAAHWAQPNVKDAARWMRFVFENREEAARRGERARRDILEKHTAAARAERLVGELERIWLSRPYEVYRARRSAAAIDRGEVSSARPAEEAMSGSAYPSAADIESLVGRGPDLESPSRFPRLARFVRRLVLRLLRNFHLHQRQVDRALLARSEERLREHDRAIADLARRLEAMEDGGHERGEPVDRDR